MSRFAARSFSAYSIVLAATALLLAVPSTARAGYPDGMNRYAGYHIMHGGVDPYGNRHRIVIDSDKSAMKYILLQKMAFD